MGHYGIVYIARNDQHPPNVYKIGATNRNVEERMRELSNETGTYGTFEAKATFPVTDWEAAESKCHRQLNKYREDKEFFKAPYNELLEVVRNVCDDFQPKPKVEQPTDGMSKALFLEPAPLARPEPPYVPPEQPPEQSSHSSDFVGGKVVSPPEQCPEQPSHSSDEPSWYQKHPVLLFLILGAIAMAVVPVLSNYF